MDLGSFLDSAAHDEETAGGDAIHDGENLLHPVDATAGTVAHADESLMDGLLGDRINVPSPALPAYPTLDATLRARAARRGAGRRVTVPALHDPKGGAHEPITLIYSGSLQKLSGALRKEGWHDPEFTPISSMTVDGHPSVLALTKNENPLSRDHLRVFALPPDPQTHEPRYGIAGSRDLQPFLQLPGDGHALNFGHRIDRNLNGERDLIMNDMLRASPAAEPSWQIVTGQHPGSARDLKTDGNVYLFNL